VVKKKVASPVATAGGGFIFEYLVGAIMLVHLLRGSPPPGLLVPVTEVALQQRARGHLLDDIVVYAEGRSLYTEFQVKRTLQVTASDSPFVDTLVQALHVLEDRAALAASGRLSVGLIARGNASAVDQLESLGDWAKGHSAPDTLAETFVPGIDARLRPRLDHVRQAVAVAIERGAPDLGGVDQAAHKFLSALQVWRPSVASNGRDLRDALRDLQPIADEFGREPGDVFANLVVLAQDLGVVAGVVDADTVRRRLRWRGLIEKAAGSEQATPSAEIDADAVIRGPLEVLKLQGRMKEAEELLPSGSAEAIDICSEIAVRMAATPSRPHTSMVLQGRAAALEAAGRQDEAVLARVELAWGKLEEAGPVEAELILVAWHGVAACCGAAQPCRSDCRAARDGWRKERHPRRGSRCHSRGMACGAVRPRGH